MPANALQNFQIIIDIVSFDFLSPYEIVDPGFTETEAFSPNFDWLGYGSRNFLENIGSIIMFAALLILTILGALLRRAARLNCKWLRERLDAGKVWSDTLGFINGVFFEILVAVVISMGIT